MRCFIDMDGVLADLTGGLAKEFNRTLPYVEGEKNEYFLEANWGISRNALSKPFEYVSFWSKLNVLPGASDIIKMAELIYRPENVYISTALPHDVNPTGPAAGKINWLEEHFPTIAEEHRFFIGTEKWAFASRDTVLIDDYDKNIEQFNDNGGTGILFPQPWNNGWHIVDGQEKLLYVKEKLKATARTGDPRFHKILAEIARLHDLKQKDYGTVKDAFANVRASEKFGIPAWVGALVRGNDKMHRLSVEAQFGQLANESAIDSFRDLAVYAIIAEILYREEKGMYETVHVDQKPESQFVFQSYP